MCALALATYYDPATACMRLSIHEHCLPSCHRDSCCIPQQGSIPLAISSLPHAITSCHAAWHLIQSMPNYWQGLETFKTEKKQASSECFKSFYVLPYCVLDREIGHRPIGACPGERSCTAADQSHQDLTSLVQEWELPRRSPVY